MQTVHSKSLQWTPGSLNSWLGPQTRSTWNWIAHKTPGRPNMSCPVKSLITEVLKTTNKYLHLMHFTWISTMSMTYMYRKQNTAFPREATWFNSTLLWPTDLCLVDKPIITPDKPSRLKATIFWQLQKPCHPPYNRHSTSHIAQGVRFTPRNLTRTTIKCCIHTMSVSIASNTSIETDWNHTKGINLTLRVQSFLKGQVWDKMKFISIQWVKITE